MNHDRLTALLEDRADDVMLRAGSLHAVRRRARHRDRHCNESPSVQQASP